MADEASRCGDGRADAAGYGDVIVLDQDGVVEAVAVVGAAAAPHGVFLEGPLAGNRLPRAADARLRVRHPIDELCRVRGDAGETAHVVECHPLGGKDGAGIPRHRRHVLPGGDAVAVPHQRPEHKRSRLLAKGRIGTGEAGDHARLARRDDGGCLGARSDRRSGRDVAGEAEVLEQGLPHGVVDED